MSTQEIILDIQGLIGQKQIVVSGYVERLGVWVVSCATLGEARGPGLDEALIELRTKAQDVARRSAQEEPQTGG